MRFFHDDLGTPDNDRRVHAAIGLIAGPEGAALGVDLAVSGVVLDALLDALVPETGA